MWVLVSMALAAALALTLRRLRHHQQVLSCLHQAIERQQPFLREDVPGTGSPAWDALCAAINTRIVQIRNIEQQQQGQLAQLEATLGSLQEAVLVVDAANYIRLANAALQAMFPHATTTVGQRLELVLHSVSFFNFIAAVRDGEARPRQEVEFSDNRGTQWVEATGSLMPAPDGERGPWVLFVLHDITRQRRLERVRTEFVANVSHELRTPLSVIKGYVETLVEGGADMPAEDRQRFLLTVQRHTDRLDSLLKDLLTLSRLESATPGLQLEVLPVAPLIEEIATDYRSRPNAAGHQIETRLDPELGALAIDALKITQVLHNLLENALKYTPTGTRILLGAKAEATEVIVTVADEGPGIPAGDLPHVFERFYRVDKGRSREQGGTGLGLSIVKHIIQLHGGRVWVESELGQGSTFGFSLPRKGGASVAG